MTRYPEPPWLHALLEGGLTPDVPVVRDLKYGDVHRGSPAMAELACVAALSGRSPSNDVQVLDPTVGRGVMLQTVAGALRACGSAVHATGLDINAAVLEETRRSSLAAGEAWSLRLGNVLTDDLVPSTSAELVVSEPPWGLDWRASAPSVHERAAQGWYPHGVGRVSDAGWLFLQRGIAAMRSREQGGSRFVTFVNPAMLNDKQGQVSREWLVKQDMLEALVRLPVGMAENAEIPLYVLLLRTDKPRSMEGRAHVIDLRGYMTTRDKGARRRISRDGLKLLWSALETRRIGPSNRIVSLDSFERQLVQVSPGGDSSISFRTEVSSADPGGDVKGRYGPVQVGWTEAGQTFVSFTVDRLLDSAVGSKPIRGVEYTRLAVLLKAPPEVHGPEQGSDSASDVIWLPTGRGTATTTTPTATSGRILRLHVNPDIVHADYLAGWLNSDEGILAIQEAQARGASGQFVSAVRSDSASLWRLMDELRVPIRANDEQLLFAESLLTLRRVETLVQAARADLWSGDKAADLAVSPFAPLLDNSLERWTTSLPYPFATALWTLTSRNSIDAKHRQIFHTWESYAAFLATVLLSALRQDADLAEVEGASLRSALTVQGLSLERPSFGAWAVVIQRLSALFRQLLREDAVSVKSNETVAVSSFGVGARAG